MQCFAELFHNFFIISYFRI